MEWIKKLKVSQKLYALIVVGLFFLLLVAITGFSFLKIASNDMADLYNYSLVPIKQLGQLRVHANANMANLLSMILENNPQQKKIYGEDLKRRVVETKETLAAYEQSEMTNEEKQLLSEYKDSMEDYISARTKVVDLAMAGKRDAAWDVYRNEALPKFRMYVTYIGKLSDLNAKSAEEINVQNEKNATTASWILALIGLSAVLLLLIFGLMVSKMITKPIEQAIDGLNIGSDELSSASSQVASASQALAEGSSEQAAAIQETSATLEETLSMVHQNRENTQQAASLARQAKQFAEKSHVEMVNMSESMDNLKNSSHEIAKIIKVIDEIAFQTNLLSLNAAVEAARAGDAGKGFAVVAEEVRNLAQRSAQAAKDTTVIIESNIDLSENSVNIAKGVRESVESIGEQARKVSDLLEEISVATNEQEQGVEQINKAVSQMEIALGSNASTADESAAASLALSEQAIKVKDIVNSLVVLVEGAEAAASRSRSMVSVSSRNINNNSATKTKNSLSISQNKQIPEAIIPLNDF